jgi:hypothetical protein
MDAARSRIVLGIMGKNLFRMDNDYNVLTDVIHSITTSRHVNLARPPKAPVGNFVAC